MRGKDNVFGARVDAAGITPAYAGKSAKEYACVGSCWDHPRVCGEKLYSIEIMKSDMGSPPRMRGKGVSWEKAGYHRWDHPRVCGEKADWVEVYSGNAGSPPRMRGKGGPCGLYGRAYGITPAYAGKRHREAQGITSIWDHPRVCGEKLPFLLRGFSASGSPPRMRGKVRELC